MSIAGSHRNWLLFSLLTLLVHLTYLALTLALLTHVSLLRNVDPLPAHKDQLLLSAFILDCLLAVLTTGHLAKSYYRLGIDSHDEWNGVKQQSDYPTRLCLVAVTALTIAVVCIHAVLRTSGGMTTPPRLALDVIFAITAVALVAITLYGTMWKAEPEENVKEVGFDPDTTLVDPEAPPQ